MLSTTSRPALRVAACGGRPRAGSATTGTGVPASPITPGKRWPNRTPADLSLLADSGESLELTERVAAIGPRTLTLGAPAFSGGTG
jgi:hypothetical protein